MRALLLALVALAVAVPAAALAATPVELRDSPVSHGASITLADLFDGTDSQAFLGRAAAAGAQTVLDAARVQAIARQSGLQWDNAHGVHRIIVGSDPGAAPSLRIGSGAHPAVIRVTASRSHRPQTLIYARNLQTGEIVGGSDLIWSEDAVASGDSVGDPDLAIGKAARHALRAGAAVNGADLLAPHVIKRDAPVKVLFESDGISLSLDGKAMADARLGDPVQVMNPASKRIIDAVASGPGEALVGPRADMLKNQQFQPGAARLQTAALR